MAAQQVPERDQSPDETALLGNPPIKNALVVTSLLFGSLLVGGWAALEFTNELGTAVTWLWIGIGLSVLYLLNDIANTVKDLVN
ncbi:hypothetical protein [Natrialba sp. SSL1]|uniref:hypothetical protein n=1 Tax=Natrialba sp. SSL1 TaxID=1869245 RepID=UPI0008F9534F|nr:hypothetical protein [Natrialba sp. SSL1]OIB56078.1 hypothetical protein BBD46_19865 [Natrialba sp. SSL1]